MKSGAPEGINNEKEVPIAILASAELRSQSTVSCLPDLLVSRILSIQISKIFVSVIYLFNNEQTRQVHGVFNLL